MIDSSHRRPQDSNHDYRVYFGVPDDTGATSRGDTFRNVVAVNVIDAEIPRTADNIIAGQNTINVRVDGVDYYATVQHGLYLDVPAVSAVLLDAFQAMGAVDASGVSVAWDVEVDARSRLRVYASHAFTIVADPAHIAFPFQLGLTSAASVISTTNDGTGVASPVTFPFMIESARFTNLMPRSYVDVVIPQVPRFGTKLTNSPGQAAERVIARIPLGSTPGGAEHYEPGETLLLRDHFAPITLPYITIQLFGSDGLPYDSRDTPHRIALEVVELDDPLIPDPPPPPPPQAPTNVEVNITNADIPVNWFDENKWNLVFATTGTLLTIYIFNRLREMIWQPSTGHRPLHATEFRAPMPPPPMRSVRYAS